MQREQLEALLLPLFPAGWSITRANHLSELWAGYGHIYRISLSPPASTSPSEQHDATYIVKTICPPRTNGEAYDEGHARKMLSYQVEANFYREFAQQLRGSGHDGCEIPRLRAASSAGDRGQTLVLEDLAIRYPILAEKRGRLSEAQLYKALEWLASFHARSWAIDTTPTQSSFCPPPSQAETWQGRGLWQKGGYHYLATRREEFESIDRQTDPWARLGLHAGSDLAESIDWCLYNPADRNRLSLIHGDVKAANMAFSRDATRMAMYDFQYVGIGLGVQDLAKFLTTSIPPHHLATPEAEQNLLRNYHSSLLSKLPPGADYDFDDFVHDWQLALVSWVRFLAGWSGGFWGNVDWLTTRVQSLLKDKLWIQRVRTRYHQHHQS